MKKTFKYVKVLSVAVMAFATLALTGCKKESHYIANGDADAPYVLFGGTGTTMTEFHVSQNGFIGDNYLTELTYDMYTNAPDWEVVPDYSECFDPSVKWIVVYPSSGQYDGRFHVSIKPNIDQGDLRKAKINIVSNGQVLKSIYVSQDAFTLTFFIQPFLINQEFEWNAPFKTVSVSANVKWNVRVNDDEDGFPVEWLHVNITSNFGFDIYCDPNTTGFDREATLTVYQESNVNNFKIVTVKQKAESFEEPTPDPNPGEGGENTNPDGGENTNPDGGENTNPDGGENTNPGGGENA